MTYVSIGKLRDQAGRVDSACTEIRQAWPPVDRATVHAEVRRRTGALGPADVDVALSDRLIEKHRQIIYPAKCAWNCFRIWRLELGKLLPAGTRYAEGFGVWDFDYLKTGAGWDCDFQGYLALPDGRVVDLMRQYFAFSLLAPVLSRGEGWDGDVPVIRDDDRMALAFADTAERVTAAYRDVLKG